MALGLKDLERTLRLAAQDGFAALARSSHLGVALQRAGETLLLSPELPIRHRSLLAAWCAQLDVFQSASRDEQEIAVARGLRILSHLAVSGPARTARGMSRSSSRAKSEQGALASSSRAKSEQGALASSAFPSASAGAAAKKPRAKSKLGAVGSSVGSSVASSSVASSSVASSSVADVALETLPGIGPTLGERLREYGFGSAVDLVTFFPRDYDDLRHAKPFGAVLDALEEDEPPPPRLTLTGQVRKVRALRFRRRMVQVELEDGDARLKLTWFGVHLGMAQRFVVGQSVVVSGRLRARAGRWEMANPDFLGDPNGDVVRNAGIRPRYAAIDGVKQGTLRTSIGHAVERHAENVPDGVPPQIAQELGLPSLVCALSRLHKPPSDLPAAELQALVESRSPWHERLAFEDLFLLALAVARRRRERHADVAQPCVAPGDALSRLRACLPFALTSAQERAIAAVTKDLAQSVPMNRLLQGDVGAGKTVVALAAAWQAIAAGRQAAIMAPTELLAEQHARSLQPWTKALGIRSALLTASTPQGSKVSTARLIGAGALDLVIGTHALLAESLEWSNLGVVVIDEQHRFGVGQRVRLREKGDRTCVPHLLVMTATPIPRTLALAFYGDLDVSTLDELPPGRQPPQTRVLRGKKGRGAALEALDATLAAGGRAFVVCPMVAPQKDEDGEPRPWADVATVGAELAARLAPRRVGMVHGQMTFAERERAMTEFREGAVDVLVATTVIEVGVDVPQATLMWIEDADRFGLAQLHQLRGRVGRGGGQSLCLLVSREAGATGSAARPSDAYGATGSAARPSDAYGATGAAVSESALRLGAMEKESSGFAIAEADLAIRGPGELLGARQAGLPRIRFGTLEEHVALLQKAKRAADALMESDPGLENHAPVLQALERRLRAGRAYGAESG